MTRPFITTLLVATLAVLLLAPTVPAAEIQGRVVLTGQGPAPKKVPVTIDQYVCGTEKEAGDLVLSPAREVRNVVVWLENPPPGAPSTPPAAEG